MQLYRTQADGLLSIAAFRAWLARAKPGERLQYHRGFLVCDRAAGSEQFRRRLVAVADAIFEAAAAGKVYLIQRRDGPCNFAYFAIKAGAVRQREGVSSSMSAFDPDGQRAAA